jgi:curved DNA-binding protein CbpA
MLAIKHGLFKLNITDHHAVLGVSLDAKPKEIRLQYLKIAQKLHPDKCRSDEARMKVAGQILSKLVNPAYEQLSRKNAFAEHQLILTQVGKRIAENRDKVTVKSSQAQELLEAGNSAELVYHKLLKKLSAEQYESLEQAEAKIGAISELNLVYLMLQGDRRINRHQTTPQPTTAKTNNPPANPTPAAPANPAPIIEEPTTESRVAAFVDRAQQYISKGEFDRAIKELKDALRIDPNNGIAHAVMGRAYLHKRQLTMAKVHISKACRAEPHNPIVTDSKRALDKLTKVADKSKRSNPDSDRKSGNSSFFSGFFGAK